MKKFRPILLVYGMVLMLIAMAPISAIAGGTPNGQPFLEIWEELEILQGEIENLTLDIEDLQAQLDAEIAARIAGDAALQAEIDAEEIARIAADIALQAAIDAEEAARIAADLALQNNIDAEAAARIAADAALQAAINAEEAARIAGDAAMQAAIDAEEAARIAADNTLQANIDAEAAARAAADATLQAAIDAEAAARQAADAVLQSNIDALAAEDALDYDSLADLENAMANGVNLAKTSGNVGIGTTSPGAKLDVHVTSGGAATIGHSSNKATGDYAIALGYGTDAREEYSTAMGYETNAWGDYSTAMGRYTTAWGSDSTAMGYETTASGAYSTAAGYISTSMGSSSTAMGYRVYARGTQSTAMGSESTAWGHYSTAMGHKSYASGPFSTAMGRYSTASGDRSTAMGGQTTASGTGSTAMGLGSTASGGFSTAMGYDSTASGERSTAMGERATASGYVSTAMGYRTTANGPFSTAMGYRTTTTAHFTTAMGRETTASAYHATAMGYKTTASGWSSTAMGQSSTASGSYSTAMGGYTTASGYYSTAMGYNTEANAHMSTAMGRSMTVNGFYSFGIGLDSTSTPWIVNQDSTMAIMGGKVGIGTTSPTHKLTVQSLDEDTLRLIGPDSLGHGARINFGNSDYAYIEEDTNDHLLVHSRLGTKFSGGEVTVEDKIELLPHSVYGGIITTFGPNGHRNVRISSLSGGDNNGFVSVYDSAGNSQVGMYVNSAGDGVVFGDTKNFRVDNPNDPNTDIWYASVEGPEAAAYIRGTGQLVNGQAVITFPDHFLAVAVEEGMTVQVTPLSAESKGLSVTTKSLDGVVVQELSDGKGNYEFDWEVKCVRQGHEDYQVIRPNMEETPGLEGDIPPKDSLLKEPVSLTMNINTETWAKP